jgi:RNA 3'-terminal phosphate cyclase
MLTIKSPTNFRHTILCSIIAEQPLQLEDINHNKNPPGLKPE